MGDFVLPKRGTKVLLIQLKGMVLHTNIKLSEKLIFNTLAQNIVMIGTGYCLPLITSINWDRLPIQQAHPSFLGMMKERLADLLSCWGTKFLAKLGGSIHAWMRVNKCRSQDWDAWHWFDIRINVNVYLAEIVHTERVIKHLFNCFEDD